MIGHREWEMGNGVRASGFANGEGRTLEGSDGSWLKTKPYRGHQKPRIAKFKKTKFFFRGVRG